ncbi:reverse transcriptase domain-containing protein [Tanacetum coccineum]
MPLQFPEYHVFFPHLIIILSDSDVEDTFSSTHSPDYIPASPDYFPASPGNTSPNFSDDLTKDLLALLALLPFYDDPYMKVMKAYDATDNELPIPPQAPIAPPTILPPSLISPPKDAETPVESPIQISPSSSVGSSSLMPPKRTSTSAAPAMTRAAIRQLVADNVDAALEAQAATMAIFSHRNYTEDCKVKFSIGTLTKDALSWWNSYAKPIGIEQADKIAWTELKRLLTNKYYPRTKVKKMEDKFYNLVVKGNDLKTYARRFQELTVLCPNMVPNNEKLKEAFIGGLPRSIEGNVTASKPQILEEAITITQKLMDHVTKHDVEQGTNDYKGKYDDRRNNNNNYPNNHDNNNYPNNRDNNNYPNDRSNNNYQNNHNNNINNRNNDYHHQQNERQETFRTYRNRGYNGPHPLCRKCTLHHIGPYTVRLRDKVVTFIFYTFAINQISPVKDLLASLALSPFYDDPYMKVMQAYYATDKKLPIPPQPPIALPTILPPSLVLSLSPMFDFRHFFPPEKISPPKYAETPVESPIPISLSSSVGSSSPVRLTTPPSDYPFDKSIFAKLDNSLWIIPQPLGSEPVPEKPNESDAC